MGIGTRGKVPDLISSILSAPSWTAQSSLGSLRDTIFSH